MSIQKIIHHQTFHQTCLNDLKYLRIEQYFQVQDYALWDVIENGNSFKPAAQTTTNVDGSSTTLIPSPVTADEKNQKKNDVKERSMLLMVLPNEHLLTFNQYKDAKTLFAAIQTRFGGNDATKKTWKTLLKQMLQKIISQLAILSENISQEDLNLKILRIFLLSGIFMLWFGGINLILDTMSFDDLYNNFKIVKQEVKGTASTSSISTANTQVSTTSTQVSTANLSDDTVYAFLASQPNESQLVHEDLEQIHKDDLEEMDLKWKLALLSMRTRNFMADEEVPTDMALIAFSDSKFNISEFNLATYKRGLTSVEEQPVFYKKNEVLFNEQLDVLKRDISYKDSKISVLKRSQIPDKSRKGLGFVSYNVVPPPPIRLFSPPNLDLSNSGLEEFQQPEFEGYGPKTSKSVSEDTSNEVRESPDASLVEKLVSNDKLEKKTVFPTVAKINFANCNYHQRERMISGNNYTRVNYNYSTKKAHPSAHRNIVPRAVLMKTGLRPLNTARLVNTTHPKTIVYSARPMSCFSKSAQSTVKSPYSIKTTLTNKNYSQKVNTANGSFYTARPKAVNTARPNSAVVNVVRANQGHPQKEDQGYVDSGCSRHMTWNMSYLSDFKEFDRGYVAFGVGANGGRITSKGTLKTGKLDFEDVYFVNEL
ncbi:hypothetical protein Tco_0319403 [Tanacetum coccineum]